MSFAIFSYIPKNIPAVEEEKHDFANKFKKSQDLLESKEPWLTGGAISNLFSYEEDHIVIKLFDDAEALPGFGYDKGEGLQLVHSPVDIEPTQLDPMDNSNAVVLSLVGKHDFTSFGVNRFEDDPEELSFEIVPLRVEVLFTVDENDEAEEEIPFAVDERRANDSDAEFDFDAADQFNVLDVSAPVVTASVAFAVVDLGVEVGSKDAARFSLENQSSSDTAVLKVSQHGNIGIESSGAFDAVEDLLISIDYNLLHGSGAQFKISVEITFEDTPVAHGVAVGQVDEAPILLDFLSQFGEDGFLEFFMDSASILEFLDAAEQGEPDHSDNAAVEVDEAANPQEHAAEIGDGSVGLSHVDDIPIVLPMDG